MVFELIFSIILLAAVFLALLIGYFVGVKLRDHYWQDKVPGIREDAIGKSRAVLAGQFSEQLAPYLPDFPYSPSEARFIGKPIDFVVFKGADNKKIEEVVFVEVKSSKSSLNQQEKSLKETILDKRVKWFEYKVPEDIAKKKN